MSSSSQDFEHYQNECLEEMSSLQKEFMKLYDIEAYEEWFYDHDYGVMHFKSHSGKNLYFKYVEVGSFSTNTNTWNWAWDNESTPKHVYTGLEKVKVFGEKSNFEQLTTGLFEGDEYTGWALTAISAKLLNAIDMYRVPSKHLFIYFLFTRELSQGQFDELKDKFIACAAHQSGRVAFVCNHLINKSLKGFNEAFESDPFTEPEDDYQAWCDDCEIVRLKEGEWNDISMAFADIKVVCDQCYFEIKNRNMKE